MEVKKYRNFKDNLLKDNLLLKFIIIVEALLIAYLSFTIVSRTKTEKTVFLPPQVTYKEFWVSGNQVSKSYLDNMGAFISYNLLNITEKNANKLVANIMPLVKSTTYNSVKKELKKMIKVLLENQITRVFYFFDTETKTTEDKRNLLIINGQLIDMVGDSAIKTRKASLVVEYEINFGRFEIVNLVLKEEK